VQIHHSVSFVIPGLILSSLVSPYGTLPGLVNAQPLHVAYRQHFHACTSFIDFLSFDVLNVFSFRNNCDTSGSPSHDDQAHSPPVTTKADTSTYTILPLLSASSSIEHQPGLKCRSHSHEIYPANNASRIDTKAGRNSVPPINMLP
jgi:hypothetical protein